MDDYDHYRYYGFIQVGMKKGKDQDLRMNGQWQAPEGSNVQSLNNPKEDWYGKLYYQVIMNNSTNEKPIIPCWEWISIIHFQLSRVLK